MDYPTKPDAGSGELAQEGGADEAQRMLASYYDLASRAWNIPQVGDFWDAVRIAHQLDRLGDGTTVAIVDDGFDMSIPALSEHTLVWPAADGERTAHGSAVALLVLAVAPRASLRLYACTKARKWRRDLVLKAILDAADNAAHVLNLSLGQPVEPETMIDRTRSSILNRPDVWPDLSGDYLTFYTNLCMSELDGWRDVLSPPSTDIGSAATAAASSGVSVVAATGNQNYDVFSPGVEKLVYSVGFNSEQRTVTPEGLEVAEGGPPMRYEQSRFGCDFQIRQPPDVLGSSFATPLIAGFGALMVDRTNLDAYRRVGFLASLAADSMILLTEQSDWEDHRHGVVKQIFEKALAAVPHRHYLSEQRYVCPECAVFAIDTYVNYGLFLLNLGDLDGAQGLLEAACTFAPLQAAAFANLGVLLGYRARLAHDNHDWEAVVRLLEQAQQPMLRAVLLRPDYPKYKERYDEFLIASLDPRNWAPVR